jgi:hypothetical protein
MADVLFKALSKPLEDPERVSARETLIKFSLSTGNIE